MKNLFQSTTALLLAATLGCGAAVDAPSAPEEPPRIAVEQSEHPFASPIERAHGHARWIDAEVFESGLTIRFGGQTLFDGTMTMTTDMGRVRLAASDGPVVVWDGTDAWVAPADAAIYEPRFQVLTWPYFLAVPMKLRDPGARLEPLGEQRLLDAPHDAARLTFDSGVGDTPDDWYIVYREAGSNRVKALAYIVTYGTALEKAEADPHAIVYDGFVEVDGVVIPTLWTFRMWSAELGIHGEPLGDAVLRDPRFLTSDPALFAPPPDARRAPLSEPPAAG